MTSRAEFPAASWRGRDGQRSGQRDDKAAGEPSAAVPEVKVEATGWPE